MNEATLTTAGPGAEGATEIMIPGGEAMRADLARAGRLFTGAMEDIVEAGGIVAKWVRAGADVLDMATEAGIPPSVIRALHRVGQAELEPRLLLAGYAARRHLEQLPYAVQCEALDSGVELLELDENGARSVRRLPVSALTGEQSAQVFGRCGVRALEEQAAWLSSRREREVRARLAAKEQRPAVRVEGKGPGRSEGFIVVGSVKITHSELLAYAQATA